MKINDQQQLVFYLDKPCRLNRSYGALYAPIVLRQQIRALLLEMESILDEFIGFGIGHLVIAARILLDVRRSQVIQAG